LHLQRGKVDLTPADLTRARKSMGMNQADLAAKLGYGWQTVSAWENGRRAIPGAVALAVEHLANCKGT